jgi:hypothetical protein
MILLKELFKSKVNVDWTSQGVNHYGTFEIENHKYVIQLFKLTKYNPVTPFLNPIKGKEVPLTSNTWFFSFASFDEGFISDDKTNFGNAILIFSTVLNELVNFAKKNSVDCLYFGSTNNKKRISLYEKLTSKFIKKYDWELFGKTKGDFFGDKKIVWIVKEK